MRCNIAWKSICIWNIRLFSFDTSYLNIFCWSETLWFRVDRCFSHMDWSYDNKMLLLKKQKKKKIIIIKWFLRTRVFMLYKYYVDAWKTKKKTHLRSTKRNREISENEAEEEEKCCILNKRVREIAQFINM